MNVGTELPLWSPPAVTKKQLVLYAGASGDDNLIHTDDETARASGLSGVIAHGMLSMGLLGRYATDQFGLESMRRFSVRFCGMVRPGDVLTFGGSVTGRTEDGLELALWVDIQDGTRVAVCEAQVVLPNPCAGAGKEFANAFPVGTTWSDCVLVDETLVTTHAGGAGILSTPSMIKLMEGACHSAVAGRLGSEFSTVGYAVDVRHYAAAALGERVIVTGLLKKAYGRRLVFDVRCIDGERLIGRGTHRRAIVPAEAS